MERLTNMHTVFFVKGVFHVVKGTSEGFQLDRRKLETGDFWALVRKLGTKREFISAVLYRLLDKMV